MLAWLFEIVIGHFCGHQFENIAHGALYDGEYHDGIYYIQQCKKCGKIRQIKCR